MPLQASLGSCTDRGPDGWVQPGVASAHKTRAMDSPSNSGDGLACSLGLPGSKVATGWSRPVLRDGGQVGITSAQPLTHGVWRPMGILQVIKVRRVRRKDAKPRMQRANYKAIHGFSTAQRVSAPNPLAVQGSNVIQSLPSLSNIYVRFLRVFFGLIAHLLLALIKIPFSNCTTVCLSIYLLKAILIASRFGTVMIKPAINIHMQIFVCIKS